MKSSRLLAILLWLIPPFLLILSPPVFAAPDPNSCSVQGGHCTPFPCAFGSQISADDCGLFHCCPNANSSKSYYCSTNGGTDNGINTAIGCVPFNNPKDLINALLSWAFGIAGGIAFILLLVAGFQLATSAGDPKRVKAAKELIASALEGLILIVLAVVVLNFIGVNVLNLTGLGFNR